MTLKCNQCLSIFEVEEGGEMLCPSCGTDMGSSDHKNSGFAEKAKLALKKKYVFTCGECNKPFKVTVRMAGKTILCRSCKTKLRIPYPES